MWTAIAVLTLATFWVWETIRYLAMTYLSTIYDISRPGHPFIVLALPLAVTWPHWQEAFAVAALVGILHTLLERLNDAPQPVQMRRNRGRLPRLP